MQHLGLHYDPPYVHLAFLSGDAKKIEIHSLKTLSNVSLADVKQLYMVGLKGKIITGVNALVRLLDFKISSLKTIEKGLPFQIETLTHIPISDILHSSLIDANKTNSNATIFLTKKEMVQNQLREWNQHEIYPDILSAIPQAQLSSINQRFPDLSSAFLIHLGSLEWTITLMEEKKIKKTFYLSEGIESLLNALWEDRKKVIFQKEIPGVAKQIDLKQLKSHLNPNLSIKLEELRSKLASALYSFSYSEKDKLVVFSGHTDAFGNFCEYLLEPLPDFSRHSPPLSFEESKTCIAYGFALEGFKKPSCRIQFLKDEFIPRKTWLRSAAWAISLAIASLGLSILLIFGGHLIVQKQRREMGESLKKILDRADPVLSQKVFAEGLNKGMQQAIHLIQKHEKEVYFLSQAPSVSEFLSWISSFPLLENLRLSRDPIDIFRMDYQLVSFPKIGDTKAPYQVKVDLEFRCANPMNARKFHEALLQEEKLIDHSAELNWDFLTDSYRASFFLKNRVPHV